MHKALYRKWRPDTFGDVYGQEHITSVLKYEIENNKLSHAYLFCGSRGVGKTTCAKILAKAVNCESPIGGEPCGKCPSCLAVEAGNATDIIEMDAASNNGVDDIRDIRDEVIYAPALLKYKVYIIDEVHMLTQSAFNALLKTLEEPPSHIIFILATTEMHKLLPTIISRCQRFEFRRISTDKLSERIELIAKEEGIKLTAGASHLISRLSQGGMRDAISLLELCAGHVDEVTEEHVNEVVGGIGRERTLSLANAIIEKNYDKIFDDIDELVRSSKDISVFWQDIISFWRDMLIFKTTPRASKYLDLTDSETSSLSKTANCFSKETLLWQSRLLSDALPKITNFNETARTTAELTLMRLCDEKLDTGVDALLSRISKLEDKLKSIEATGAAVAPTTLAEAPAKGEQPSRALREKEKKEPKETEKPAEAKETKSAEKPAYPDMPDRGSGKPTDKGSEAPRASGGRVLRPFRAWVEILEELSLKDPSLWQDINTSKAFTDENGNAVIVFDGDFFLNRALSKPNNTANLESFISRNTGRQVNVSLELLPTDESGDTVIDEILDNFNS